MKNNISPSPEWIQACHQLLRHDIRAALKMRSEHVEQLILAHTHSQHDYLARIAGMSIATFTTLLLPEQLLMAVTAAATALFLVSLLPGTILIPRIVRSGLLDGIWVLVMSTLGAKAGASFLAVGMSIYYLLHIYKDMLEIRKIRRIHMEDSTELSLGDLERMHNLAKPYPLLVDVLEAWNRQEAPLTGFEYFLLVQTLASVEPGSVGPSRLAA